MTQHLAQYFAFIGVYIFLWIIIVAIPYEVDFDLAIGLGLTAMILTFIYNNKRYKIFDNINTYYLHIAATCLIIGIIVLYDFSYGLTEISNVGYNTVRIQNSKFYEYSLGGMHSVILGSLILIIYSIFKRKWRNIFLSICSLIIFFLLMALIP